MKTFRELLTIMQDFDSDVVRSEFNMGVHFDCDCGCGGDLYTDQDWATMGRYYDESYNAAQKACEELGLEWDYD